MPDLRSHLLVLFLPLLACTSSGAAALDAAITADARGDAGPLVVDTGPLYLEECMAYNRRCEGSHADDPECGACQYRIRYRADACSADSPCDDLFLYWAAVHCGLDGIVEATAHIFAEHPEFVTVCMQPIYPGEILPTSLGAPERDDEVVRQALQRLRPGGDLGIWSGANLLMGGCSMGATRYPVVAARYAEDSLWLGSDKTGVCISDGVVDVGYQDRFIGAGTGPSCPGRHRRVAHAYTVAQPVPGHACAASPLGQCACDPEHAVLEYAGDCADGDCVSFDSIVKEDGDSFAFAPGIRATDFAAPHWKLISEGGAWADDLDQRCENDVVPAAPLAGLCALIDADDGHTCTYESFPDQPHCSFYNTHLNSLCLDWFLAL